MENKAYKIEVVERDIWSGPSTFDCKVCLTIEDAKNFKEEFNARNTAPVAPDWYEQVEGKPVEIILSNSQYQSLLELGRTWLSELKKL